MQNPLRRQSLNKAIRPGIIFFFALTTELFAYGDNNGRGTRAIALANSFVSIADNAWATLYNPAGLSQLTTFQASAFFIPQQFGLTELKTVALATGFPTEFVSAGVEIEQFGFELYRESFLRVGIGTNLDRNVMWGVAVNLGRLSIERYGSAQLSSCDMGLLAKLQNDIRLGFAWKNVFAAKITPSNDRLPQVFLLGGSYAVTSDLHIVLEMEKDVRYATILKLGIDKSLFNILRIMAGISNNPDKFSVGMGLNYAQIEFGYAGYSHVDLGWTHQIELGFQLGE